jgi:hypothetical protein
MGRRNDGSKGKRMNYLDKAKDYAVQWSVDRKGEHEFVFDQVGLEYFLDSLNIDFLAEPPKKDWADLTYEDMIKVWNETYKGGDVLPTTFAFAIEKKLKEKNK